MSNSRDRRLRRTRGTPRDAADAKVKLERSKTAGQHEQIVFPDKDAIRDAVLEGICPCCGRGPFILLARHMNARHGIDTREMRDLAGLTYTESIIPPSFREQRSKIALDLIAEGRMKATPPSTKGRSPRTSGAGRERQLRGSQSVRVARGDCSVCGEPIPDSALAKQSTCGRAECIHEAIAAPRRATRWPRQPCEVCGSPLPEHSQARHKTCSKRCAGILGRRTSPGRALNATQVEEIRRLRAEGVSRRQVAAKFGISPDTVTGITGGKRWKTGQVQQ